MGKLSVSVGLFAWLFVAEPFLSSGPFAQTLYAATAPRTVGPNVTGRLYVVDPATAESKLIGRIRIGGAASVRITGMAVHPATGVLYGSSAGFSFPPSLLTIDPRTAEARIIGPLGYPTSDLSFDRNGQLYAWLSDLHQLAAVNLNTGAATPQGPVIGAAESTGGGLAIDRADIAYVIPGTAAGTIDTINIATLKSEVGPILTGAPYLSSINSLTLSVKGGIYGVNSNMAASAKTALVFINPKTGIVTKIGDLPEDVDGLAFSPDVVSAGAAQPEQSSRLVQIALMALAVILAGIFVLITHRKIRPPGQDSNHGKR